MVYVSLASVDSSILAMFHQLYTNVAKMMSNLKMVMTNGIHAEYDKIDVTTLQHSKK
jgi:hypothetical protein